MLDHPQWSETDARATQASWRNCPETLRYALASVYTQGAGFRRRLIRKAIDPIAAPPFEVGLDPRPIVQLAWTVEQGERYHRIICSSLVSLTILGWLFQADPALFIVLFGLAALTCGIHGSRSATALRAFTRNSFNLTVADKYVQQTPFEELSYCISSPDQNVIVHKDFDPFKSLGVAFGKWSFTVDVSRPANFYGDNSPPKSVSASEIETIIRNEISNSEFGTITTRRIITVRGEDAFALPMKHRTKRRFGSTLEAARQSYREDGGENVLSQPVVSLRDSDIQEISTRSNLARSYTLFHDIRWGGELILSHVVRTQKKGHIFYIEASRFVLTPLAADFKSIDKKTLNDHAAILFFRSAAVSPLLSLLATYEFLAYHFGTKRSAKARANDYLHSLKDNPIYNYGADESTRREMMDEKFDHFSQKADLDFSVKAFDQTIVDLICRYMEERGVDVSDLRNKMMTIYNSGIMVQGGDVTAQAMAVGQGANAQSAPVAKNPLNLRAQTL